MKKKILIILLIAFAKISIADAAVTAEISVSTSNTIVGNSGTAVLTITADSPIGQAYGTFSCGGLGEKTVSYVNTTGEKRTSYPVTIDWTAKSSGTYTCSVSGLSVGILSRPEDGVFSVSASSKTITVKSGSSSSSGGSSSSGSTGGGTTSSKKNYSSDNYLKELGVEGYELSPKFDKDTLEYSLKVDESVEKIKINVTANDSKASVSGAGEITLTPGENKIEIKVTAENGNEKVYKLNITVEDQKPIKVTIDKANYTIVKKNHDETIKPENFEETTIKIDDQDVIAYVNKKSNLTLVVLKNNQGKTGLYVYDAKKKSYTPYKVLKVGSLTLYIQNMDKNDIPKGYSKYSFKVNDVSYTSYRLSQSSKFDLIYGMNVENGEKSLYIYDEKEGTLQRYDEDMLKDLTSKYKSEQKYLYIAVSGLIALSLVLIVVLIVSNKKKKRKNKVKI